jgi:hypothetical protein
MLIDDLLRLAHRAFDRIIGRGKEIGANELAHENVLANLLFDAAR